MHCEICKGKGTVKSMGPARGNSPYVQTVHVVCGVCRGTGVVTEDLTEPSEPKTEKTAPRRTLMKPTQATTMKKIDAVNTESGDENKPLSK
jgi:hypothetical protein